MIITSAPGKLFIAGEYAVVEPGYPAILVAINQFIMVSLEKALAQEVSAHMAIHLYYGQEKMIDLF